jgi:hypothetical protein
VKLNASDKMPMEFYQKRCHHLELHHKIMDEAHFSEYSLHPGTNKMYQDLKKNFWWTRMKREIVKYVLECDTC